jgi:hypothetical protein
MYNELTIAPRGALMPVLVLYDKGLAAEWREKEHNAGNGEGGHTGTRHCKENSLRVECCIFIFWVSEAQTKKISLLIQVRLITMWFYRIVHLGFMYVGTVAG